MRLKAHLGCWLTTHVMEIFPFVAQKDAAMLAQQLTDAIASRYDADQQFENILGLDAVDVFRTLLDNFASYRELPESLRVVASASYLEMLRQVPGVWARQWLRSHLYLNILRSDPAVQSKQTKPRSPQEQLYAAQLADAAITALKLQVTDQELFVLMPRFMEAEFQIATKYPKALGPGVVTKDLLDKLRTPKPPDAENP